jgi:hypothetical protein
LAWGIDHLRLGRIFTFLPNAIDSLTTFPEYEQPPSPLRLNIRPTAGSLDQAITLAQAYEIRSCSYAIRPLATASASA